MQAPGAVVVTPLVSTVPGIADRAESGNWQPLFDGRSLHGWAETPFEGRWTVRVENPSRWGSRLTRPPPRLRKLEYRLLPAGQKP
jgi:hypothetical protein